jgi:uncharacterized protein YggE
MSKSTVAASLICLATLLGAGPGPALSHGQSGDNIEGFTVAGKGTVSARPNSVEIDLEISAASELTADAIVKYRDARKKIQESFAGLKLANVSVAERGLLVDKKSEMQNPYMFGGMQNNSRAKTEVQLSRKMVVVAKDIRQMDEDKLLQQVSRLLDVAQDAGAKVGPQNNAFMNWRYGIESSNGLVRFVLDDFEKLEEEAYEKAIADARARAERLAKLSRVELGPVVGVREVSVPGDQASPSPAPYFFYGMNTGGNDNEVPKKRLESGKFQEIPVTVQLLVRFDIQSSKPGAKGRPGG